jgi:hypothetical protein
LFQAYCRGIICRDICEIGKLALFVKACCWGICCCNGRIEFQECPVLRALPCVKNDCWIYHWAMTLMAAIYQAQNFMARQVLTHIWRGLTKSSLCKNKPTIWKLAVCMCTKVTSHEIMEAHTTGPSCTAAFHKSKRATPLNKMTLVIQ